MVKSTPLLKKRIVKKRTLKFTRFQSDLYGGRLAESWRRPRGTPITTQALITAWEEDSEVTKKCPKSDMDQTTPPSITSPTDLKNSLSTTTAILTFFSWTTEPSAQKLHTTSALEYLFLHSETRLDCEASSTNQSESDQRKRKSQNWRKEAIGMIWLYLNWHLSAINTITYHRLTTITILNIRMSKETGLIIGSIVFLILGIVAAVVFYVYIKMKSPPHAVAANRQYSSVDTGSEWCRWW